MLNETGPLSVSFVGIDEHQMWPGKRGRGRAGPAIDLFARLDPWIEEQTGGTVDALLLGCVGGVVDI